MLSRKKSEKQKDASVIRDQVLKRSKFFHGLFSNIRYSVFNWSFKISVIILIIFFIFNRFVYKANLNKDTVVLYVCKHDVGFTEISIGAISAIIASLAVLLVIFNRKQLRLIAKSDSTSFEDFTFPYKWSATLWIIIIIMSWIYSMIFKQLIVNYKIIFFYYLFYYFFMFLLIYASLYMLYLIFEIMEYILLAALSDGN